MIKKSSRIKYAYCGEQLNIKEIYSRNKKRRGNSKYLLSVDVMAGKENPIPAKIVCVRNKANRKDWLAFICTDKGLACFYLYRYDSFRRRDHPYLWKTLADRGFLQNL